MTKTYAEICIKRAEKATPGPWHFDIGNGEVESQDPMHFRIAVAHRDDLLNRKDHCEHFKLEYNPPEFPVDPDDDMEFIAHARQDVPELSRRLKWVCEKLRRIAIRGTASIEYLNGLADELEKPMGDG